MIAIGFLALLAFNGALSSSVPLHPLSDEYIDHINNLQTTWKAGRNFPKDTPIAHIKRLLGALKSGKEDTLETIYHVKADKVIPESFDARENWPSCESIKTIRDQSDCGSCWAVAAAAAMSDRICISSNGADQTLVSDEDLTSCCWLCGNGCNGGYPYIAWQYWALNGIVSGGPYNSTTGCRAYSLQPCYHHGAPESNLPNCTTLNYKTPKCVEKCDEGSSLSYQESKTYGSRTYRINNNVEQIQLEIMENGPVEASFEVYSDFASYESGIYQKTSNDYLGGHAVRMIGWGVENDVPFWLITNSWNEGFGEKGLFKILRGENECGIESGIVAGKPKL